MSDRNEQRVVYESDWDAETDLDPTLAIVSAVATAEECDPTELPPLYDAIDTNALNRLVSPSAERSANRLAFRYCGYEIRVHSAGIQLQAPTTQS